MSVAMHGVERSGSAMLSALHAAHPASDRAGSVMLYGQFVGSWIGRRVAWDAQGGHSEWRAEVHFGWVLQGRAVQDVWIARAGSGGEPRMYGTTLRVYDPQAGHWHITWTDPVSQACARMIGRKVGDEIVQECRTEQGVLRQWLFTDIADESFHWVWRDASADGKGWDVRAEYFLRRSG
jgi:hypothetical protein